MPRLRSLLQALVVGIVLCAGGPADAQMPDPPPDAYDGGMLDAISRKLFVVNSYLTSGFTAAGHWLSGSTPIPDGGLGAAPPSALGIGIGNVASNLVNEPVTAVAGLATGAFETSWHATKRFAINSTVGVLGWYDAATDDWNLPRRHEDVGLLLCRAGIGEGGYIVLPLVGPRTLRDGAADVVVTNAILWTIVGTALGTGISLQTFLLAETIEIAADILATRQMDSHAADMRFEDYDHMRAAYLSERRERCAARRLTRAARHGQAVSSFSSRIGRSRTRTPVA